MNKFKWVILVSSTLFFGCKSKVEPLKPTTPPPVLVDVIIASSTSLSNTLEVSGSVIPFESVDLKPELSGRLTYLNMPEGIAIKQGSILAKINDADLQGQMSKTKVQLQLAETTEGRLKKLIAINGINQADYDNALNQVKSLKADLNIIQAQIDKTILKAPFSGMLGLRLVSPGAFVTNTTVLSTLQQTDKLKIDFTVPELYSQFITKGSTVKIESNQIKSQSSATITATESQINTTTRNLRARAVLEGSTLKAGAFVKVLINTGTNSKSIVVPTSCIIPDARTQKVIVVKNGKGKFVDIVGGLRNAGGLEIKSGLQVGDSIVVSGVLFVRPNQPVKVKQVKKLEDLL